MRHGSLLRSDQEIEYEVRTRSSLETRDSHVETFFQKPIGAISLIGGALFGPYVYFGGIESPTKEPAHAITSKTRGFLRTIRPP